MRSFDEYNPIVTLVYFLSLSTVVAFSRDPILLLIAFLGSFTYFTLRNRGKSVKTHLFFFTVFAILALVNPLVSHRGATVLLLVNGLPITLEACVFGVVGAGSVLTVLYLFRSFSEIMTRDRLLYAFGRMTPKTALVFSMTLRYMPLLRERAQKISESQRAIGLYKEENIIDRIKNNLRVFSILVTWALENGITTADSMAARGYGSKKWSYYSDIRFRKGDLFMLVLISACLSIVLVAIILGAHGISFYPRITHAPVGGLSIVSYIAYTVLSAIPIVVEIKEILKWKYLRSKI
jgi:energy-coupling factor transport system permease protein